MADYVKTSNLLVLLKQAHLGGVINECVLDISRGKGTVEAIDITNTIVFISTLNVASRSVRGELGLGSLDMVIKFLSTMSDNKLNTEITANRMIIKRKDKRRRLDYLLSQPQLIATRLRMDGDKSENIEQKFLSSVEVQAELDESFIKDFNSYITTLKTKVVTVVIEDDDVWFHLGPKSEHQFKLSLPLVENDESFEINVKVNGEYLSKIFAAIEFDDEEGTTIGFGEDSPIVIESPLGMWAISPSEDLEEE